MPIATTVVAAYLATILVVNLGAAFRLSEAAVRGLARLAFTLKPEPLLASCASGSPTICDFHS